MRRFWKNFAALVLALAGPYVNPALAQALPEPVGTWHGEVDTPIGQLMLVLEITRSPDGALAAEVESRDQAPGRTAPVSVIAADRGLLSFQVDSLRASYKGAWSAADKAWKGTFSQGADYPLVLSQGDAAAKPVVAGLDGYWTGSITRNGVTLRQGLHVFTGPKGTTALYESPDQMLAGAPVRELARDGEKVRFTFLNGQYAYAGTLAPGGGRIDGKLAGTGADDIALILTRAAAVSAAPRRPQEPKAPFPYRAEEVSIPNPAAPGVTLAGSLTLPQGKGPFPAAILVTGSGPQDRDETLMGHKPFAVIADHLTRSGYAVLRLDDRGTAKSTGNYPAATSADFASDTNAAFRWLAGRSDIKAKAIGLIGHSEGGMIGPIAMAANPQVAYLIMLAGPGTRLDRLMVSQQRLVGAQMGRSDAEMDKSEPVMAAIFSAVAKSRSDADIDAAVAAILTPQAKASLGLRPGTPANAVAGQFKGPWLRYFLTYDPAPNLARIKVPVLALNGSLDRQVPATENLPAIRAALARNRDATIVELPGLNHLFQTAKTGGIGEYQSIEETFSPAALDLMTAWLEKRFPPR